MKTAAAVDQNASEARSGFVQHFNNVYKCMGAQDQMEQEEEAHEEAMMMNKQQQELGGAKLFAAEDADEAEAPKKGGMFG